MPDANSDEDASKKAFGRRGRRLWSELVDETTPESDRALIEEACRTADRLDRLDWACKRDGIIELVENEDVDGMSFTVTIGNAMSEARQQGNALRQLLVEIARRQTGNATPTDDVLAD